eukprot:TRINITY_DN2995_c0_g1_i1.p1 TRINITY_DN2995_c0_g1~~TRINITY_DN2995_c0_g1_i1.p1  ORF type:complete len:127 (+),score=7.69 TRINITY_DN2995_c0_g1_i1:141-521(+)
MSSGWPLGLENMNIRLRGTETTLQAAAVEPNSFHTRSTSFSSFTSSDLDTESTKSFFQDHSITLGRLIGIKSGEGDLYFTESIQSEEHNPPSTVKRHEMDVSHGICIPLILSVLIKIGSSRSSSRR